MVDSHNDESITPPTIETERLVLRPLSSDDAVEIARLAADRDIAATTLHIPHPYKLQDAEEFIGKQEAAFEAGTSANVAVTLRSNGSLVGAIGLAVRRDYARAELGYWIGKPYWNDGYATEAGRAMVGYAFETLGLNRVCAHHFARNAASGRVLQKIGMRLEGCLRQHIRKWDRYEDCVYYGILKTEIGHP